MDNTLSRRSIAKGAAWSMPVVALGAAAPASAASCAPDNRTATLSITSSTTSGGLIKWVNNGPDTIPKGTTISFSMFFTGTTSNSVTGVTAPSSSYDFVGTVGNSRGTNYINAPLSFPNPNFDLTEANPSTTIPCSVTFAADLAPNAMFQSSLTMATSSAVPVATATPTTAATPNTAKSQTMHPMSTGSAATHYDAYAIIPGSTQTQTFTNSLGCPGTLTLTVPTTNE